MRHLVTLLKIISGLLVEEARLRADRVEGNDLDDLPGRWVAALDEWNRSSETINVHWYHRTEWTGLAFQEKVAKRYVDKMWVTVRFIRSCEGSPRVERTPREKWVDMEFRKVLRAESLPEDLGEGVGQPWRITEGGEPGRPEEFVLRPGDSNQLWTSKKLVVDLINPSEQQILEQLVVYCSQTGLQDDSVWNYRNSMDKNDRGGQGEESCVGELVKTFVDPDWPRSYSKYKSQLVNKYRRKCFDSIHSSVDFETLCRIEKMKVRKQLGKAGEANLELSESTLCEGTTEPDQSIFKESPEAVSHSSSSSQSESIRIFQACREFGIPRSTLYRMIQLGKLSFRKVKGRLVIDRADLSGLIEKNIWREVKALRAELTNPVAARKWVERQKKRSIKPTKLLMELQDRLG